MRESLKIALGGMIAALSVVIMLITYLSPFLVYTAPPFAGLLLICVLEEIDRKWAFGVYVAISLLSLFLIADKEAAVFYTMFFGYYPVLRSALEKKLKKKLPVFFIGLLVFNLSAAGAIAVCAFVFHVDYSEFSEYGRILTALFILLMNLCFFFYDVLLRKLKQLYLIKIQPRLRKLFR